MGGADAGNSQDTGNAANNNIDKDNYNTSNKNNIGSSEACKVDELVLTIVKMFMMLMTIIQMRIIVILATIIEMGLILTIVKILVI